MGRPDPVARSLSRAGGTAAGFKAGIAAGGSKSSDGWTDTSQLAVLVLIGIHWRAIQGLLRTARLGSAEIRGEAACPNGVRAGSNRPGSDPGHVQTLSGLGVAEKPWLVTHQCAAAGLRRRGCSRGVRSGRDLWATLRIARSWACTSSSRQKAGSANDVYERGAAQRISCWVEGPVRGAGVRHLRHLRNEGDRLAVPGRRHAPELGRGAAGGVG